MLIPDRIDADSSAGEKLVFYKFRNDGQTEPYYVLHSLFINKHLKNVSGEIDFLVLMPGQGIFCLEVKHGRVSRDGGTWTFEDRSGRKSTSTKGPFRQVADTMHSLRKWLSENSATSPELQNQIKNLVFGWGVLFTSLDHFRDFGSEAEPWQICTNQIKSIRLSDFMLSLARGWHEKYSGHFWYNETNSRPSAKTCQKIMQLLRGDFSYNYREINRITEQETIIHEFTREQFDVLDFTEYNSRCLVEGPAGTGKTVLAEELFRRKVAEGKRVAFVCYNRLLGQKIAANAKTLSESFESDYYAGTLHSYMIKTLGTEPQDTPNYFSEILPLEYLIHAEEMPETNRFDYLIIDEAQDLLTENYLEVFDSMLTGGLKVGAWCCFGDLTGQAIYINDPVKVMSSLSERATFSRYPPLRINCRNTRRIADQNTLLTGVERAKLNTPSPDGDAVDIFFVNSETISARIEEIVRSLVNDKVSLERINILSAQRWEGSHLDCRYLNDKRKEGLEFHTIHSFKVLRIQLSS